MTRIAIVGGGPGGLFAAKLLEEFCADLCEITLFEASARLGGKIVTSTFKSAPVTYEAGVAEVYDYSHFGPDPIRQLIEKLGLATVRMTGPAVILGDAILRNDADIRHHFGAKTLKAVRSFQKLCRDLCTPEDYYEGHWQDDNSHPWSDKTFAQVLDEIPDEVARKYIEVAARSDVATESHLTSALNGLKNVLMDDPRYLRLYSIEGGIQRLTDAVASQLKSPVHLESAVVRVAKNDDGTYRLTARRPCLPSPAGRGVGGEGTFVDDDFDMVIMALPNYWLQRVEWGSRDLRLAMQKHLAHYDTPAHYLRMSILFQKPFWRKQVPGSYFMTDAFGGCCVYDEGARHPCEPYGVLGWLLAGNDAMSLGNHTDERLIELALDSLPKSLAQGRSLFLEGRVQRWVGSISGLPGGQPTHETRLRHLPDVKGHPGLFVVGDYLFDSTVNGVYDSADFVTDMILAQLRKKKYMHQFDDYPESQARPADTNGKLAQANGALTHKNGKKSKPSGDDHVDPRYHDFYYGDVSYEEAFKESLCFNADWTLQLIEAVWGKAPPYRMLDSGSASGLTLEVLAKAGVEAWGIENSKHIHSQTPAAWRHRNLLGDVRKLPFPDNHFDFVYDTCLPHVPPDQLDAAVRELFRVCRHGVFFSGVTADMTREVIEDYNLFQGVRSLYTLWEWSEIFMRNGFRMAVADQKTLAKIWKIESEIEEDDWYWYADAESMRYCFYSKPAAKATAAPKAVVNGHLSKEYYDYYDGDRPYAESWKDCFCERYTGSDPGDLGMVASLHPPRRGLRQRLDAAGVCQGRRRCLGSREQRVHSRPDSGCLAQAESARRRARASVPRQLVRFRVRNVPVPRAEEGPRPGAARAVPRLPGRRVLQLGRVGYDARANRRARHG
jgi:protoporphyrinogen oxidase/SAM-dependent methyltransferase